MRKIKYLSMVLLLLLLCSSCFNTINSKTASNPDISNQETQQDNQKAIITNEMMLADYDYMWTILEENYPYYEIAQTMHSFNINETKQYYQREIAKCKENDVVTYYNIIRESLLKFRNIGHLSTMDPSSFSNSYEAASRSTDSQDGLDLYRDKVVINFYETYFEARPKSGEQIKIEQKPIEERLDSILSLSWEDTIPIITISSFHMPTNEGMDLMAERLNQYLEQCRNSENIIVDVRGNGGGGTGPWLDSFLPFVINDITKTTMYAAYKGGKENLAGFVPTPIVGQEVMDKYNTIYSSWSINEIERIKDGITIDGIIKSDIEHFDYLLKSSHSYNDIKTDIPYTGHFWILVDGECASASDEFINRMKEVAKATTIGEKTKGMSGIPIAPALLKVKLPQTGLLISFQPTYVFNADGSCREFGTNPDILVGKQDALTVCLENINKENNAS